MTVQRRLFGEAHCRGRVGGHCRGGGRRAAGGEGGTLQGEAHCRGGEVHCRGSEVHCRGREAHSEGRRAAVKAGEGLASELAAFLID